MSSKMSRKPVYVADRRELLLGDVVIKQFRQPAPDQEAILLAFEELGWPEKIDDPLQPDGVQDGHVRLNNVIKNLNRNQRSALIHFRGNGLGDGILWEIREPEAEES